MNLSLIDIERVIASLRGSTAAVDYPELPDFVRQCLEARAGRANAALTRSAEIRAGIRQAIGALPVDAWGVSGVVQRRIANKGPGRYGLARVPDVETVRRTLAEMRAENKVAETELDPRLSPSCGASIGTSTST